MDIGRHPVLGKWRITGMELWDADFIDLLGPGYIRFDAQGGGEFAFGAVQGELDCHHGPASIHFTWEGSDEMDRACGDGDAQLEDDGTLTGEPPRLLRRPQPLRGWGHDEEEDGGELLA